MDLPAPLFDDVTGSPGLRTERRPGDQRQAGRVPVGRRTVLHRPQGTEMVVVREISPGGVGLLCRVRLRPAEVFTIELPRRSGRPVSVLCSVVRCEKGGGGGGVFVVGATFRTLANPEPVGKAEAAEVMRIRRAIFDAA